MLRLLLSAATVGLCLLFLEAGLRLFHPVGLHPTDTFLRPNWNASGPSARAGFMTLVPNAATRYQSDEFDVGVRINSRGFRDREIPPDKAPGVYRVLVIGDSQTFGVGVEAGETYAKRLEADLRAATGRRIETLNAGVPGTGTAHHMYFLDERGWAYHPDAVVLGFFFNDVGDSGLCRLYRLEGTRVVSTGEAAPDALPFHEAVGVPAESGGVMVVQAPQPAPPPQPSFWVRHSHLVRYVRQTVAALARDDDQKIPEARRIQSEELTARLLAAISEKCRSRGVTFLLALIPSREECSSRAVPSLLESDRQILRYVPAPASQVLDLTGPFRAAGYRRLYFAHDQHMTAAGHDLAAALMAKRLAAIDPRLKMGTVRP